MEYVRSPKLGPLVFEVQTCKGQHVRRRGRGALQAQRAGQRPLPPCPSCARRTALSPWRRAAGPGLCGGLQRDAVLPEPVAVRGARLVPEGFAGRDAGPGRLPLGPHRVGHLRAEPRERGVHALQRAPQRRRLRAEIYGLGPCLRAVPGCVPWAWAVPRA